MLKPIEVKRLEKFSSGLINGVDCDEKTFDICSHIDNELNFYENKKILKQKISELYPIDITIDVHKKNLVLEEKDEFKFNQKLKEFEIEAEKEFEKSLDKIESDETSNLIEEIYYIPKQFVKMVANGNARGLLLWGEAGLGKTYSVIRAFKEAKKDFVMLSGHITSMELFHFLFEHRKKNIVLDDVNVLENEQNLNMLKASLNDNLRVVQYHTSSKRLRVPNKFLFEGSLIVLLNNVPRKTESLKAVESRILNFELKADYKTKIKIIYELAKQNYKSLSKEERFKIVKWIKKNTSEATENLNLRLLFSIYEMRLFDKENWKKLASKIICNNEELQMILNGMGEKEWCKITQRHRATYYKYKQKLNLPKWKRKS